MFYSDFSRQPIDHENPSGTNPINQEDFDEVKRQINNINRVTGIVSWQKIEDSSKKILTYHAKDLRCACYYAVAVTHNQGLKGLIDGLTVISDICSIYWHTAFPAKEKIAARISLFEWYIKYTCRQQKKIQVTKQDLALVELGYYLVSSIEKELKSHYDTQTPSFGSILHTFNLWKEEIKGKQEVLNEDTKNIKNNVKLKMYFVASIIVVCFFVVLGHLEYEEIKIENLKKQINVSTINNLSMITKRMNRDNSETNLAIKDAIFSRAKIIVDNLEYDPISINKIKDIDSILNSLTVFYPDTPFSKTLIDNVYLNKVNLENEYIKINESFLNVRTHFANANTSDNHNEFVETAYKYSNTLFPLLGRIEYAEKERSHAEVEKAQKILNVYQHKLNGIKYNLKGI